MTETVAVVDAADHFLRWENRWTVHEQRLVHRSVHIALFRPDGNLVIQRRHRDKQTYPSHWDISASGHVARADYLAGPDEHLEHLRPLHLLTAKPVLYVANVDEAGLVASPRVEQLREHALREGAALVPVCAGAEAEIARLDPAERGEFLADLGMEEPGLQRVVQAGYRLLGLITFFTTRSGMVQAWTVPQGATAARAAGVIHTDFERGFIRAEVVHFDDFVSCGGEQAAKDAGRWRLEGKEYPVQDGDVMTFRCNA
jgi:ribosome-binding ATPase YchF (GTP1/OBG family)